MSKIRVERKLNKAQKQYILSNIFADLIRQNGKFSIGDVIKRIHFLDEMMDINVDDIKDEIAIELSTGKIYPRNLKD